MTNLIRASVIIENNWNNIKTLMCQSWIQLTKNDIDSINNYAELLNKLKTVYALTEEEAIEEIDNFIDKVCLDSNLSRLQELTEAFCGSSFERQSYSFSRYLYKDTPTIYNDMTDYAVKNPLKVLGLGILAPVTIKKIVSKQCGLV